MKKIIRIFFLTAISAGIINLAQAQRSRDSRGGGGHVDRVSRSSSHSYSAPTRSMTSRRDAQPRTFNNRSVSTNNRTIATRNMSRSNIVARTPQRNTTVFNTRSTIVTRNGYNGYGNINRGGYYNNYSYHNNYRYHNYYGNVYGRRTVFMYGTRYRFIPHSFISIRFGGYPYYYHSGFYYGYYNGFYQPIFPPFGLRIAVLPFGYSSFYWGGYPYYYYNGIYYRHYGDDGYEVVDAPMGSTVSTLPGGATSVIVNGETLYELNGTYYKAGGDSNGNTDFTVVGKNGVINNTISATDNQSYAPQQAPPTNNPEALTNESQQSSSQMQIGDTMSQLPDGSKLITIDGQQLYQTPDNVYLKGEINDGIVKFKVVGK
jgi:hypothetical protein